MDLLFLDDIITLTILDVFSKYRILTRVRPEDPQEVWGAFLPSWVGVFGAPKVCIRGEGGEWNAVLRERRIKLVLQGVGARPWILERRNGLARGIHSLLKAGRFYTGSQI